MHARQRSPRDREIELNNEIQVFPNPFSSEIQLQCSQPIGKCTLQLSNSLGQCIKTIATDFNQQLILNLDDIPTGIYFISIQNQQQRFTKKLIKQ